MVSEGKSQGNKVVMTKLQREEFSRLQHYCKLKGESINSAIKRIVMGEVDKPSNEPASSKEITIRNIVFDTNTFDEILAGEMPLDLIKKSISLGYRYFITHIQTDELSNIPDNKKDKRAKLVLFLSSVSPSLIPTESFVLGYSRLGFAKLGTPGFYEKLLNENKTNIKDSIIGDTAIKNNFILVTEDDKFFKKIKELGGNAITTLEFIKKIKEELKE